MSALSVCWPQDLVRPTLDTTMAYVQRPDVYFCTFSLTEIFIHFLMIYPCLIQSILIYPNHVLFIKPSGLKYAFFSELFTYKSVTSCRTQLNIASNTFVSCFLILSIRNDLFVSLIFFYPQYLLHVDVHHISVHPHGFWDLSMLFFS